MDREKVKKELLELNAKAYGLWVHDQKNEFLAQIGNVTDDALALLKEQEVELSYREAKAITHTATKLDDATCPSCGNVVGEKIRTGAIGQSVVQVRWDYCRFCGQKLDWEGR